MRREEQDALARMRDCWFAGGAAFNLAPDHWKAVAEANDAPTREIVLLALAGQAFQVGHRPASPSFIANVALPNLPLPTVPDATRHLFRSTLKEFNEHGLTRHLLGFVASRGFVAHPLDWVPESASVLVPDVYAPWIDWVARHEVEHSAADDPLSEENWDAYFPAARRGELSRMRAQDPAAARALLQAKAGGEPAEAHLRLVQIMQTNLQTDDRAYLESLLTDRSGKVKSLAAQLLARLGVSVGDRDEKLAAHAELADFFEMKKSLFLRKRELAPRTLKTTAQEQRRADLFELCTLRDLAARFETDEAGFVESWSFNRHEGIDAMLVGMAARTASDAALHILTNRMIEAGGRALTQAPHLMPRLSSSDASALQSAALKTLDIDALGAFLSNAPLFSTFGIDELWKFPLVRTLRKDCAKGELGRRRYRLEHGLRLIAFLVHHASAQDLIDKLVAVGLSPANPCLNSLRLNAALPPREPRSRAG